MIADWILVSDGELRALAHGIVPRRVRARALELSTSLLVKLHTNASRRKRMAKAARRQKATV